MASPRYDAHKTGTDSKCRFTGHQGSPAHALITADDRHVAKSLFVCIGIALFEYF
jgi:hypothetical protein